MLNINNILQHNAPLEIFQAWYEEAKNHEVDPSAFSLATADSNGRVSNRYLLYKGILPFQQNIKDEIRVEKCLSFVSNFQSHKAKQITQNNFVAMNFYWRNWQRQIRIEGRVYQLDSLISDKMFLARSQESRLASILSQQSSPLESYEELLKRFEQVSLDPKAHGINIEKRPENWGAYGIVPDRIIFFEYGPHRLNKRVEFLLKNDVWTSQWLSP